MAFLRYVIQEHTTPTGVHWDLMLEDAGRLLTWRLNIPPDRLSAAPAEAVKIFDHPLKYLTYEGPVQQETGQVRLADAGAYIRLEWNEGRYVIHLKGAVLTGTFELKKQIDTWILQQVTSGK